MISRKSGGSDGGLTKDPTASPKAAMPRRRSPKRVNEVNAVMRSDAASSDPAADTRTASGTLNTPGIEASTQKAPPPRGGRIARESPTAPVAEAVSRAERAVPVTADVRRAMIAEAAYHRAAARGFQSGYDVEDWLAAEQEVDRTLAERELEQGPRGVERRM
jgi:hypothetical protein